MLQIQNKQKGILSLIILSLLFASMGIFARYLVVFSVLQQVYLRVGVALLLGYIIFHKDISFSKIKRIQTREWILLFLRSLFLYGLAVTFLTVAFIFAKYGNTTFIGSMPFTAFFGIILLKERFSLGKTLFIILAFLGAALIGVRSFSDIFLWGKGETFALISTVCFSLSYIARRWHSSLLNDKEITLLIFFISVVILFLTSIIAGQGLPVKGWSPFLLLIVVLAGFFNIFTLYLTNYGFKRVETVLASNILALESVFGVIIGFLFYAEVLSVKEFIGGIAILVSVIGMNYLHRKT